MGSGEVDFSKAKLKRELRSITGMHVSDSAGEVMLQVCEGHFSLLANEAASNARHAGRKTISAADLKKAAETIQRIMASL